MKTQVAWRLRSVTGPLCTHPQHVPAVTRGNIPYPDCVVVGARDDDVLLHVVDHSVNHLSVALQLYHRGLRLLVEAEWIPAWLDFTMNCLRLLTVTRPFGCTTCVSILNTMAERRPE